MQLALRDSIVFLIRAYLGGGAAAAELEEWLLSITWNIHKHPDTAARELAGSAMLYLAEYDRGHRTDAELRELLHALLPPAGRLEDGSGNRTQYVTGFMVPAPA